MDTYVAEPIIRPPSTPAPLPEVLVLDWTDYCNAKCFFCYREKYEQQIGGRGEFVPFVKLRMLETALRHVKVFGVSSGIGEPLLHPELQQILTWLYEINPSVLIRTTTNGTALTADKAPWFAGHIDWLSVSLNAANAEAHMRDMFPHLARRGIDAKKRWELHLRHLREFIAALPPADRPRVRFQMVAHRHNVQDIVDFVDVVHGLGGSHAVITNIAVHADTVDWSLYWVRDAYNEAVEAACAHGASIGVRVDAARFFTSIKPVLDLDAVCRDPLDIAYISRASVGAPCCQWAEAGIPTDVYSDENGFERYWNHDILQRLRKKRDMESCRVCGMSRVFDEASFHFSPKLKQDLIADGRLSEIDNVNDYPDAGLVKACVACGVDLPGIRRSLSRLGLGVELAGRIEAEGVEAVRALDQACWDAFGNDEPTADAVDLSLAGPLLGIGWGIPIYEPQNRISARWLGGTLAASVFVRIEPGLDYELRFTLHHASPVELAGRLGIIANGRALAVRHSRDETERAVVSAILPDDLARADGGRLWVQVGCFDTAGEPVAGNLSFARFEVSDTRAIEIEHATRSAFARGVLTRRLSDVGQEHRGSD
jgi:MoaA/NifB/PqqE/SkfB family radical SAM enzyme